jgi:hypothetical protein
MRRSHRFRLVLVCVVLMLVGATIFTAGTRVDSVSIRAASPDAAAGLRLLQPPPPPPAACLANASWITNPMPPMEIGNGTPISQQTNCQFYQFSWQWFLALTQPAPAPNTGSRVFETLPMFIPGKTDQCADTTKLLRGSDPQTVGGSMFIRVTKSATPPFRFVFPKDIGQAGDGDVLYDQEKNVVFYNVRFDEIECQATAAGFKPGTMELKTSWRRITPADRGRYYSISAYIPGVAPVPVLLGLVGFHLVRNTADHPEFVWATFEQEDNVPDCTKPAPTPSAGWAFLSGSCAQCLAQNGIGGCPQCNFNTAAANTGLTGGPDQICRVFNDGTGPSNASSNNKTNRENVDALNAQLVGPTGLLTKLPDSNPMAVWKHYRNTGALWTNGGQASTPVNQRGSLNLANSTMETFLQASPTNCFSCHDFSNPKQPLKLSHIYRDLRGAAQSQ